MRFTITTKFVIYTQNLAHAQEVKIPREIKSSFGSLNKPRTKQQAATAPPCRLSPRSIIQPPKSRRHFRTGEVLAATTKSCNPVQQTFIIGSLIANNGSICVDYKAERRKLRSHEAQGRNEPDCEFPSNAGSLVSTITVFHRGNSTRLGRSSCELIYSHDGTPANLCVLCCVTYLCV